MSIEIPVDFVPFVRRLVDSRRFLSEEDVVLEGLRMLHAREILRAEVEKGFEEPDAGTALRLFRPTVGKAKHVHPCFAPAMMHAICPNR